MYTRGQFREPELYKESEEPNQGTNTEKEKRRYITHKYRKIIHKKLRKHEPVVFEE